MPSCRTLGDINASILKGLAQMHFPVAAVLPSSQILFDGERMGFLLLL